MFASNCYSKRKVYRFMDAIHLYILFEKDHHKKIQFRVAKQRPASEPFLSSAKQFVL